MNIMVLFGRIDSDPAITAGNDGKPVVSFDVLDHQTDSGKKTLYSAIAYGRMATRLAEKKLYKSTPILLVGRLRDRSSEGGQQQRQLVIDFFNFLNDLK